MTLCTKNYNLKKGTSGTEIVPLTLFPLGLVMEQSNSEYLSTDF